MSGAYVLVLLFVLAAGPQTDGGLVEQPATSLETQQYFNRFRSRVGREVSLPSFLTAAERAAMMVEVSLRLDAEGRVLDVSLLKTSKNERIDAELMAAIRRAAPFGPPPVQLRPSLEREGVVLRVTP